MSSGNGGGGGEGGRLAWRGVGRRGVGGVGRAFPAVFVEGARHADEARCLQAQGRRGRDGSVGSLLHSSAPTLTHPQGNSLLISPYLHLPPLQKETISLPSSLPPSPSLLPSLTNKERCTPFIRLSVSHPNPSPPTRKLRPSLPSSPPPSVAFTLTLPHTQGKMYSLLLSLRNSP